MNKKNFKNTLIIGLGLIGGSFAKALRQAELSENICAYDFDIESLDLAKSDGVIDKGSDNFDYFSEEFLKFDFVVLATPLSVYEEIFTQISKLVSPHALVIDLGSIKNFKFKNLPKNFIGCHPIAGSENIGYENSQANLFTAKKFIICTKNAPQNLISTIKKIGSEIEFLEASKHDEIYALVSHLPQFLSFLTKEFSPKNIKDESLQKAFRLDNSDPEIWEDIFSMNEKNLEKFYLEFFQNLERNINSLKSWQNKEDSETKQFIKDNFAAVFFRVLVVKSYLEIAQIKHYSTYGGSGFKDFTSIISILPCANFTLIEQNRTKIEKFFKAIS